MKIGILILAHSNSDQLKLLVDSLKNDFILFIHIDAKSTISQYIFSEYKDVFVMKKHKIYWGSYDMIVATLDLFKWAYSYGCDYYMLISGSDFPIKSNQEIIHEIKENQDVNFISYEKLPRLDWKLEGGFDRLRLYWENLKNPKSPSFFNYFCSIGRKIQLSLNLTRKMYPLPLYGGDQWVNLSKETLEYVLGFIDNHPAYLQ